MQSIKIHCDFCGKEISGGARYFKVKLAAMRTGNCGKTMTDPLLLGYKYEFEMCEGCYNRLTASAHECEKHAKSEARDDG